MKHKYIVALLCPILITPVFAASSIQLEAGVLRNSSGSTVISGTWAVILDANNDGTLPGGLAATSASAGALVATNSTSVANEFSGITLVVGNIGSDRIIAVGSIGDVDLGDGYFTSVIGFADGEESRTFGIYWFPEQAPSSTLPTSGNFDVGGFFNFATSEFAQYGMFSPPESIALEPAVIDVTGNAINVVAVPEPSTLALSALGLAAFLRRRRN